MKYLVSPWNTTYFEKQLCERGFSDRYRTVAILLSNSMNWELYYERGNSGSGLW